MFFPFCQSQQYPTIPEDIMLQLQANNFPLLLMEQYKTIQKMTLQHLKELRLFRLSNTTLIQTLEMTLIEWQSADLRSAFIDFMYGHDIDCHKDSTLIANLYQLA